MARGFATQFSHCLCKLNVLKFDGMETKLLEVFATISLSISICMMHVVKPTVFGPPVSSPPPEKDSLGPEKLCPLKISRFVSNVATFFPSLLTSSYELDVCKVLFIFCESENLPSTLTSYPWPALINQTAAMPYQVLQPAVKLMGRI